MKNKKLGGKQNVTLKDFEEFLFDKESKAIEIKERAAKYFDRILELTGIKLDSSTKNEYEKSKRLFCKTIESHFTGGKILRQKPINLNQNILSQKLEPEIIHILQLTESEIDKIIISYALPIIFMMNVIKPYNKKIIKEYNKALKSATEYINELRFKEPEKSNVSKDNMDLIKNIRRAKAIIRSSNKRVTLSAVARELNEHRSTLQDRLDKIEKKDGIKFSNI